MATRRECREWTIQLLFQLDLNATDDLQPVFAAFWKGKRVEHAARTFTEALVRGVHDHQAEIDESIRKLAEHWALERMGVIDRNVIRLSLYEQKHCPDVPPVVSINEAVDLAKYFSSRESGNFVNGILDRARKDLKLARGKPGNTPRTKAKR